MKTCLEIVQSICKRVGIASPNAAVGSTDLQVLQILELVNEEGSEQATRYPWQALLNVGTFTTAATESQGAIETIAPGLDYIVNDTIWNRSLRRPVYGPKTPQNWEQQKAFAINGPWSGYRLQDGNLNMYPVPTAGESCYFEYITKYWATDTSGATGKSAFTVDTDLPVLLDELMILGGIWRWKAIKGFDYAEDYAKYERRLTDTMARDGGKDWLNLANTRYDIFPGIVVASGSWNL
jgi:hypothetical protein